MKEKYGVDVMGETAEKVCDLLDISREDQDAFAEWSQRKANEARARGRFRLEIAPVQISTDKMVKDGCERTIFDDDEFMKPSTTVASLAALRPAFRTGGRVTAGNSSGLNDGAAALLLASEESVRRHDLTPLARVVSSAAVGVEPSLMGLGPVPAANLALAKASLTWADIDIIELNEAFAAQCLGCLRQWGIEDTDERVNPNGGAIALGHPLGMSGARIALSAALELHRTGKKFALVTMCVGVGQGYAMVLEGCDSK
jgi:acetyl-CoA acyltransferase